MTKDFSSLSRQSSAAASTISAQILTAAADGRSPMKIGASDALMRLLWNISSRWKKFSK